MTNCNGGKPALPQRLSAEALGAFFLLATIVGSGVMAERLSNGDAMSVLLGNTFPTGAILTVLILFLGPVSGAHFNPAVTLAFLVRREITLMDGTFYVLAQVTGGLLGVAVAHAMFEMPLIQAATTHRTGLGQWIGELMATFGLVATILGTLRCRPEALPYAVGLFIATAMWFTSSTSFANPAVTLTRAFTDTVAGINPSDVPLFVAAEVVGALAATVVMGWLLGKERLDRQR